MSNDELVINRTFNLPVDKVWQAWSEAESCKKWWDRRTIPAQVAQLILEKVVNI
jgi:uncharacterized protein YndB with AHSA1/START domain